MLRAIVFLVYTVIVYPAAACTDFLLSAKDGTQLVTRTLEFTQDLHSQLRTSPRLRQFQEKAPDGSEAFSFTAKYGYLYLDGMNIDAAVDGMNEKGLSIEALYLPGYTEYPAFNNDSHKKRIPYFHLGDFLLSQFATIEDVLAELDNLNVYAALLPSQGKTIFPLHFAVYDATGKSIILEFVQGQMKVHDNAIGVLTNSPTYEWHISNLSNYTHLSPYNPAQIEWMGKRFAAPGLGAGMTGLPGDTSPPSRFIKIALLKKFANTPETGYEALVLAQHMINTLDIPAGFVRVKESSREMNEKTQWTVFKDLSHKKFFYRTYEDMTLKQIDLNQLDFSEKGQPLLMLLVEATILQDKTSFFKAQGKK